MWKAKPRTVLFEGANPRHAHEWELVGEIGVPDDKVICPGVIEPQSNYIEHPELVAQRLQRWATVVDPERLMAGVDCGFSIHVGMQGIDPDVAWAKLAAMAQGCELAASRLSRRSSNAEARGQRVQGALGLAAPGAVSTSTPSSVTRMVCSNWAVRLPSAVTAVQSSSHILCCHVPSVIIGSIVNVMPGRMIMVARGVVVVQDLEVGVELLADAVADERPHDAVAVRLGVRPRWPGRCR